MRHPRAILVRNENKGAGIERVGFVVLSIVIATAIVVGASYGALWLQPILLHVPTAWMIIASTMMASLGGLMAYRRRNRRARPLA